MTKHKGRLETFLDNILGRLSEEELDDEKFHWELCPYFRNCKVEVQRKCFGIYEDCNNYKHYERTKGFWG